MIIHAIVLAGGRSSRLGTTAKALLEFEGSTLLDRTLDAVADADRVVVVGPVTTPRAPVTREEPAFGGPAAGIAAGLALLAAAASTPHTPQDTVEPSHTAEPSDVTLVLACDMPRVQDAASALMAAARSGTVGTGLVGRDVAGRLQPLAAVYPTAALTAAADRHRAAGTLDGLSVFGLVGQLSPAPIDLPAGSTDDVDTWHDAAAFGIDAPPAATPAAPTAPTPPDTDTDTSTATHTDDTEHTMADTRDKNTILTDWTAELTAAYDMSDVPVDINAVLDLAGEAAHSVIRPAAPLTTFVAGYAAGFAAAGAADPQQAMDAAIDVALGLCRAAPQATGTDEA
ncbi:NTP transferase domain-containing protein [Marisediminicola senii]|uniref:NTP transferase domain-containing protein n=1 Tax=Marisediminicola senii TaxID=2711233 RepID=UPI0013EA4CE4|nr:NTP transferase domain-containing protein [Marisediminicola senii]